MILTVLALVFVLSSLAACNSNGEGESTSSDALTENGATEGSTEETEYSGNTIGESEFVIFENESYTCPVIVSENATDAEKKIYNKLRDKLKSLTGTLVEFKTDFKAYNDAGDDRSAPAVLIGRTNYLSVKKSMTLVYCSGVIHAGCKTLYSNSGVLVFGSRPGKN